MLILDTRFQPDSTTAQQSRGCQHAVKLSIVRQTCTRAIASRKFLDNLDPFVQPCTIRKLGRTAILSTWIAAMSDLVSIPVRVLPNLTNSSIPFLEEIRYV
jgi:hypothetical protein